MGTQHSDLFQALLEPFEKDEVKVFSKGGRQFQYVTARTVMNRLDKVLGPENWWDRYENISDHSALCELSIRLPDGQVLTKCDAGGAAAMADPGDDDKSIISDAFKRAAVKFGVSRYLYRDGTPGFADPAPSPGLETYYIHPDGDCPVSGKDLFRTIKKIEEEKHTYILKTLNDAAKKRGLNGRMIDWDHDAIAWAWGWVQDHTAPATSHQHNGGTEDSLKLLQRRLYLLAQESIKVLHPDEFAGLDSQGQKGQVKAEINNLLNAISPGELIDSLSDLRDRSQIERLIELAERTLDSRRKVQEEGAFM